METIESPKNSKFRLWKSLLEGRGIKKHGEFLLMGRKLVPELLEQRGLLFHTVLFNSNSSTEILPHHTLQQVIMAPDLFNQIDIFNTGYPILVGNTPKLEAADLSKPPLGLEVLSALGDPANQGALIRTAEAFAAKDIILLKESTTPFHPKCLRASSGSALRAPLKIGPSIKELPTQVVALDMTGTSIQNFNWPKNCRLLMGEEGQGLPQSLRANAIKIPMTEQTESLNAVAATSIALYSYRLAHSLKT